MKKNYFLYFYLLFLLFIAGCINEPVAYEDHSDFSVARAKAFFENNTADLRNVHFGLEARSGGTDDANITPNWKSAEITQTGKITTVEIPLGGDVSKIARTSGLSNAKTLYGFTTRVTTKLIVQKHVDLETPRQFVATMIDNLKQSLQGDKVRNCYGPSDYSGYVIISAVTGEYLESFQSVNGRWRKVYMAPGTKKDLKDPRNRGLHILGADASPAAYNLGEGGSSKCSKCGNMLSMCTCCKKCGGVGCSECMVTVYPTCPECGYTGPGTAAGPCLCCPFCHHYPCTCSTPPLPDPGPEPDPVWHCPLCGSRYCNGSCSSGGGGGNYPDPTVPDECPHKPCPVCGKMIRTATRASGCDSHEYCENDGMCIAVEVSVSKSVITLGDTYTITLNFTPPDADYCDITYYIVQQNGTKLSLPQPNGIFTTLTTMARIPGKFKIMAEIMQTGTLKEYSGTTGIEQIFPARSKIMEQQVVQNGINDAWNKTLTFANSSTIREYGGVVMINTRSDNTGSLYRFDAQEGLPTPYSDSTVSVTLDWVDNHYGPVQGGEFAVLIFHTHPPYWEYEGSIPYKRQVGPSTLDSINHTTIPAVVKDFQHHTGWINTKMAKTEYENSAKLYHYGIDCRKE